MLTIRCIFVVTLVVVILLDGGNCHYQAANWKEYQEAYGINVHIPYANFYVRLNLDAANGYTGTFNINGMARELPVAATFLFLNTKDTITSWVTSTSSMIIRNFVDGCPMKVSTLHENGSITVKYLGNKFDPMCKHLNCQREDIVPINSVQRKELVDPNGWTSFQSITIPYIEGVEGRAKTTSAENLRCTIDGA